MASLLRRNPRQDEVPRLRVLEEHGAALKSSSQEDAVGLLYELGEPRRIALASYDGVDPVAAVAAPPSVVEAVWFSLGLPESATKRPFWHSTSRARRRVAGAAAACCVGKP